MTLLLLLSLLLSSAASSPAQLDSVSSVVHNEATDEVISPGVIRLDASQLDRMQLEEPSGSERTCLKIRAFIFETNDDRVPKFVRETTCLRTKMHLDKVDGGSPEIGSQHGQSRILGR